MSESKFVAESEIKKERGELFNLYLKCYRSFFNFMRFIDIKNIISDGDMELLKFAKQMMSITLPQNDYSNLFGDKSEKHEMKILSTAIYVLSNERRYEKDKVFAAYFLFRRIVEICRNTQNLDLYKINYRDYDNLEKMYRKYISITDYEHIDLYRSYFNKMSKKFNKDEIIKSVLINSILTNPIDNNLNEYIDRLSKELIHASNFIDNLFDDLAVVEVEDGDEQKES